MAHLNVGILSFHVSGFSHFIWRIEDTASLTNLLLKSLLYEHASLSTEFAEMLSWCMFSGVCDNNSIMSANLLILLPTTWQRLIECF